MPVEFSPEPEHFPDPCQVAQRYQHATPCHSGADRIDCDRGIFFGADLLPDGLRQQLGEGLSAGPLDNPAQKFRIRGLVGKGLTVFTLLFYGFQNVVAEGSSLPSKASMAAKVPTNDLVQDMMMCGVRSSSAPKYFS